MAGDSSSTSRGGTTGRGDTAAGSTGTSAARGGTSAASSAGTSRSAGGVDDAGSSWGSADYGADAYAATGYDTETDDRLASRRARALDAANGEDRSRAMAFGAGIAVGALLGAGLALLLAPQSGRETRASIVRGARRIPVRARDSWDDLGEELRTALRRRGRGMRRGLRDARWKAEDMVD